MSIAGVATPRWFWTEASLQELSIRTVLSRNYLVVVSGKRDSPQRGGTEVFPPLVEKEPDAYERSP